MIVWQQLYSITRHNFLSKFSKCYGFWLLKNYPIQVDFYVVLVLQRNLHSILLSMMTMLMKRNGWYCTAADYQEPNTNCAGGGSA